MIRIVWRLTVLVIAAVLCCSAAVVLLLSVLMAIRGALAESILLGAGAVAVGLVGGRLIIWVIQVLIRRTARTP